MILSAVSKSGIRTRGWGCKDASLGTWDAGMQDVGMETKRTDVVKNKFEKKDQYTQIN